MNVEFYIKVFFRRVRKALWENGLLASSCLSARLSDSNRATDGEGICLKVHMWDFYCNMSRRKDVDTDNR